MGKKQRKTIEKKVTYTIGNPPQDPEGYSFISSMGVLNFKNGTITETRKYEKDDPQDSCFYGRTNRNV
jgi:hypothetical protein